MDLHLVDGSRRKILSANRVGDLFDVTSGELGIGNPSHSGIIPSDDSSPWLSKDVPGQKVISGRGYAKPGKISLRAP